MPVKIFGWFIIVLICIGVISITMNTCGTATKMVNNGINTAYQQFSPEQLLKKYEWFKDAHSNLDAKLANLQVYHDRFREMKSSYGPDSSIRKNWSRDDREQWNIWQSEFTGLQASYNDLAAQYNAAMVKFNYRFCNKGDLPAGATESLPREYSPYIY